MDKSEILSQEIINKKIQLKSQSTLSDDKPRTISEKLDKLKSVDPRNTALEDFDLVKESMDLLKLGFKICREKKNISDIAKLLNCVIRIKDSILNDPQYLMQQLMKMDDDQRSIFISVLERDKLMSGFKKRKLDAKKIF